MNFKRVVITGLGTINPLGHNVAEFWENLKGGVSGAGPITRFDASNFARNLLAKLKTTSPRNTSTRRRSVKWIFTASLP